jgi:uncharacterized protein (TIGR00290 family)
VETDVVIAHTEMKKRATLSWSGGKDSALALHYVLQEGKIDVTGLHTVVNAETRRVGMHGVREELIDQQAEELGIPITKIYTETSESHTPYENSMNRFFAQAKCEGIDTVVYGDIFLEDLRQYRETLLRPYDLHSVYPLWKRDTSELLIKFIDLGFKTVLCVVNQVCYDHGLLGVEIDPTFITRLPGDVDPCGERGEFHTLVYDGPIFKKALVVSRGNIVSKTYQFRILNSAGVEEMQESTFWFQDFLPGHVDSGSPEA